MNNHFVNGSKEIQNMIKGAYTCIFVVCVYVIYTYFLKI